MKWFEGSIAEAVATSKKQNSIFVVFIEGKDDSSKVMASAFDQPDISDRLNTNSFVSVKLESESESHKQFSEIYKLVPVPSVFFIGQNGSPLEIIAGENTESNVVTKLKTAVENCLAKVGTSTKNSAGTEGPSTSQVGSSQSAPVPVDQPSPVTDAAGQEPVVVQSISTEISSSDSENKNTESNTADSELPKSNPVTPESSSKSNLPVTPTQETQPQPSTSSSSVTIEDKVERAKKLLEIKKEQKKAQEEQEEKEKELERRKVGQAMMEAKRKQQERELQELRDERKREKLQEQLAKQRILEQIAQDRADRAARNAVLTLNETSAASAPAASSQPTPSAPVVDANTARLQFKMPNGQAKTHTFPADTTLAQVRQFIDNNIELPFREYQMATTFPRREFTSRDLNLDLRSLELLPSAVILIMPLQGMTISAGPGWSQAVMNMIWDLVKPLLTLSRYLQSLVWGSTDEGRTNPQPSEQTNDTSSQTPNPRHPAAANSRTIRKRGNIHSLTDADNSNDENNTWNGNSTQQM